MQKDSPQPLPSAQFPRPTAQVRSDFHPRGRTGTIRTPQDTRQARERDTGQTEGTGIGGTGGRQTQERDTLDGTGGDVGETRGRRWRGRSWRDMREADTGDGALGRGWGDRGHWRDTGETYIGGQKAGEVGVCALDTHTHTRATPPAAEFKFKLG